MLGNKEIDLANRTRNLTFAENKYAMDKNVKKEKPKNIFRTMLEDKRAIRECIRKGGNLQKLEKERGIKFAPPRMR